MKVSPSTRLCAAWWLLVLCVVGWPLSAVTFARHEPQTVLALSWGAMIISALQVILTADVRNQQENGEA